MDLHCFSPQIVYFCRDFTQKRTRGRPRKAKNQRRGVATLRMMCCSCAQIGFPLENWIGKVFYV